MNWNNIPLRVRKGPWPDHPAGPSGSGHKIPEKKMSMKPELNIMTACLGGPG
jgi:hypothetical protein